MYFDHVNTVWNKGNSNIFKKPNTFSTEKVIWDSHKVKNIDIWVANFTAMNFAIGFLFEIWEMTDW